MIDGGHLSVPGRVLLGFAVTYLVATVSESLLHRYIGHANIWTRRFWSRYPRFFGPLLRVHYRHAIVHHGLTFRVDHLTQFANAEAQAEVDRHVAPRGDDLIRRERYGLTIGLRGLFTYNLTVAPIALILYVIAGPWAVWGAMPVLTLAPLSASLVHPFLHCHPEEVATKVPVLVAFLMRTRYYRALVRHHFLHHKYPNCNFNLLLGGDYLLGTHRWPTGLDVIEMEELGFPLEELPGKEFDIQRPRRPGRNLVLRGTRSLRRGRSSPSPRPRP